MPFGWILGGKMEASCHQDGAKNRTYLEKAAKQGMPIKPTDFPWFWGSGGPNREQKSIKNRLKNEVDFGRHLGIDFWWILMGFWSEFAWIFMKFGPILEHLASLFALFLDPFRSVTCHLFIFCRINCLSLVLRFFDLRLQQWRRKLLERPFK